ncbi:13218_t:CDS:2 [Entrophospora sp. SA101]|nr:13218_t:CDS:2 [Entrophospora sp. SA101]
MDPHLWSSTHNNTNINEAHHNINLDGKSLLSAVHVAKNFDNGKYNILTSYKDKSQSQR